MISIENSITALLHAIGRRVGVLTVSQRKRIKELDPAKIAELREILPEIQSRTDLVRWLKENVP
jgi:hypothetical protein